MNKIIAGKQKCRRGQIETMGLLVVVILVSIIMFFVLSFNINKARNAPDKQEFKESQAVSNFGTAMLETTNIDCKKTMRELLTDCAYAKQISCGGSNSCEAAEETINQILDYTFNTWGYEYNLTIENNNNNQILSIATGCNVTNMKSKKEITPFGTKYGSMSMIIKTC